MKKSFTYPLMLLTAIYFASISASSAQDNVNQLSLTGSAQISASPDIAYLNASVISEKQTANEALSDTAKQLNNVLKILKDQGIDEADLQTQGMNLQPVYKHTKTTSYSSNVEPKISHYRASNGFIITIRDVTKAGEILDSVVAQGINQIHNFRFDISNPEPLENEARKLAVKNLLDKANLYAEAAHFKVGDILQMSEYSSRRPMPVAYAESARMMKSDAPSPILAGELTISAEVSATFAISQ